MLVIASSLPRTSSAAQNCLHQGNVSYRARGRVLGTIQSELNGLIAPTEDLCLGMPAIPVKGTSFLSLKTSKRQYSSIFLKLAVAVNMPVTHGLPAAPKLLIIKVTLLRWQFHFLTKRLFTHFFPPSIVRTLRKK